MMTWEQKIVQQYGQEYIFRQLAEEAAELCQASLKMVRVMQEETPVRWQEAQAHLLEEVADVKVMIELLSMNVISHDARLEIERICAQKQQRMRERMLEG